MRMNNVTVLLASTMLLLNARAPNADAGARATRRATESFLSITGVHAFSNGRVLVFDARAHRIALLDSTLTTALTVEAVGAGSGVVTSGVVALTGQADTAYLVDVSSGTVTLIDRQGRTIERLMHPGLHCVAHSAGTLIQVAGVRTLYCQIGKEARITATGIAVSDSSMLVAYDLAHTTSRSMARLRTGTLPLVTDSVNKACIQAEFIVPVFTPFPVMDYWHVLPDRDVLVLDGKLLHLSLLDSLGSHRQTVGALADSATTATELQRRDAIEQFRLAFEQARQTARDLRVPSDTPANCDPPRGRRVRALSGVAVEDAWQLARLKEEPPIHVITTLDLAAENPGFRAREVRADRNDNLWVPLTGSMSSQQRVYTVVAKTGKTMRTVTMDDGKVIVAFDQDNRAILAVPTPDGRLRLERSTIPGTEH